ncbi:MAG: hypothetical protein LBC85_06565 [Fibromonadaceae bacterium]|jgi:hypothetical protein|nr:hypothetical protein [Fibromonadaceae bacterium]
MRLFPKWPENIGFWRKWNMYCVMFIGGCLLAARFYQSVPEVVDSVEKLTWVGGVGLAFGFFMQFLKNKKL